ncbi:MAG: hypothetical protein IT167_29155 [Bryobacterales bacterium]|nr:hypothetical protein [Bryobacterales bacterium]
MTIFLSYQCYQAIHPPLVFVFGSPSTNSWRSRGRTIAASRCRSRHAGHRSRAFTRSTCNGGAFNDEEARAVVKELKRLVLEQHYKGSVGVVSPFRAHVNRIRDLAAQETRLEQALTASKFLVDTVHRFIATGMVSCVRRDQIRN